MDRAIPDAVVTGYEGLIKTLRLPDQDDRHVLAAAIHSKSQMIVTFNLKDFPASTLSNYSIEVCHPDDFIAYQLMEHPIEALAALKKQRHRLIYPLQTVDEFLETLSRQGLQRTTELLQDFLASL
ncbi:MAG: hypothetical protein ACRYFS_06995 [Janthinobacterium lividum]